MSGPSIGSADPFPGVPEASFAPGATFLSTSFAPHYVVEPTSLPNPTTLSTVTAAASSTSASSAFTDPIIADYSTTVYPDADPTPLVFPSNPDFFGLGDSFAAGIGASCGSILIDDPSNGDCKKCQGAYPYQTRFGANNQGLENAGFKFYACSGAKTDGIVNPPGPGKNSQVQQIATLKAQGLTNFDTIGWSTLSIGGNNVGFARIVTNCLVFQTSNCEAEWTRASERISSPDLQTNLTAAYTQILDQMETSPFHLYVTGYGQFYNQATDICNSKKMLPWPTNPFVTLPLLTNELRSRANLAVLALNNAINLAINTVNDQRTDGRVVRFIDIDPIYEGNRFCEERSNWKSGAWFFTPFGSDIGTTNFDITPDPVPDPTSNATVTELTIDLTAVNTTTCQDEADDSGLFYDQFQCTLAQQIELNAPDVAAAGIVNLVSNDTDDITTYNIIPPGGIAGNTLPSIPGTNPDKGFHPKTIALAATAKKVQLSWYIRW